MRILRVLCFTATLAALLTPGARADQNDKLTYFTFSSPVEIPGMTLPAGTYTFKLADPDTTRRIVRIFGKDNNKLYATLLSIPDERLKPADKAIVTFRERPSGSPEAMRAWFYPGERMGYEFVYPRNQALKLAKETHQSVPSIAEEARNGSGILGLTPIEKVTIERVDENGALASVNTPSQETRVAAAQTAPSASAAAEQGKKSPARVARAELPHTASPLMLLGLLSGAAFVGAAASRGLRTRLSNTR